MIKTIVVLAATSLTLAAATGCSAAPDDAGSGDEAALSGAADGGSSAAADVSIGDGCKPSKDELFVSTSTLRVKNTSSVTIALAPPSWNDPEAAVYVIQPGQIATVRTGNGTYVCATETQAGTYTFYVSVPETPCPNNCG